MPPKAQITSYELSQRLHKLGIRQKSYFKWVSYGPRKIVKTRFYEPLLKHEFAAYTVGELGLLLPPNYASYRLPTQEPTGEQRFKCSQVASTIQGTEEYVEATSEADARGGMLEALVLHSLVSVDRVNAIELRGG